jgi:hypothetical protein
MKNEWIQHRKSASMDYQPEPEQPKVFAKVLQPFAFVGNFVENRPIVKKFPTRFPTTLLVRPLLQQPLANLSSLN